MTNFEEKLKDFLLEQDVEGLWVKSLEEAKEELEEDWDLMETAINIFHDLLVEYVYDWIAENIQDETAKELLTEAVNDIDFDNVVNAIIIEQHLMEV
jgi:hypothetical protein